MMFREESKASSTYVARLIFIGARPLREILDLWRAFKFDLLSEFR
jgi:hypothetical protein